MSATLVSSNTTIKVNGAVNTSRSSTGAIYTAPSNGYAIINWFLDITVTGANCSISDGSIVLYSSSTTDGQAYGYYLGPGLSLSLSIGGGASATAYLRGVEFINTP